MRETIVVGDLHGAYDEFSELLDRINYSASRHRLILCADILDRGPNPVGLLQKIRHMGLEVVASNHDVKAYRWRKYEERKKLTGETNPIRDPNPKRKEEWSSLSSKDLDWIGALPHIIDAGNNYHVVHGGVEFGLPFEQQIYDNVIRVRVVDKFGKLVKVKNGQEPPLGTTFWAESWNQPHNILFGHTVFKDAPRIFKNQNNICIGLDGGAIYGGSLIGYNITTGTHVAVQARKKYYFPGKI